jgi:multiple sugar transport system substrate-binding protein
VISHTLSPPSGIKPESAVNTISDQINDALQSKGVIP